MRLDKLLADMQVGTRSEVKKLIKAGLVTINGTTAADPGLQVDPLCDHISLKGREICYEAYEYYMFYKPMGCVTARTDNVHKSVMDYIAGSRKDLSPVGRLDLDTTGLLLITNDGKLSHELLSPAKHVKKLYEARVKGVVTPEDTAAFRQGLDIGDDTRTKPAELTIIQAGEESLVRVALTEGRFHQVKRMFKALGKEVLSLKRLAMGSLTLDESLQPGEYRKLTREELAKLMQTEDMLC